MWASNGRWWWKLSQDSVNSKLSVLLSTLLTSTLTEGLCVTETLSSFFFWLFTGSCLAGPGMDTVGGCLPVTGRRGWGFVQPWLSLAPEFPLGLRMRLFVDVCCAKRVLLCISSKLRRRVGILSTLQALAEVTANASFSFFSTSSLMPSPLSFSHPRGGNLNLLPCTVVKRLFSVSLTLCELFCSVSIDVTNGSASLNDSE